MVQTKWIPSSSYSSILIGWHCLAKWVWMTFAPIQPYNPTDVSLPMHTSMECMQHTHKLYAEIHSFVNTWINSSKLSCNVFPNVVFRYNWYVIFYWFCRRRRCCCGCYCCCCWCWNCRSRINSANQFISIAKVLTKRKDWNKNWKERNKEKELFSLQIALVGQQTLCCFFYESGSKWQTK